MSENRPKLLHVEARVLGVLIEKSLTMPDSYPLSINAITNGCNQKSNRLPVLSLSEGEVMVALEGLIPKGLAGRVVGAGSRVEKFRQTATDALRVGAGPLALMTELLVRGPQTPGELRARVHRMVPTPTLEDLTPHIERLVGAELAHEIAPAPGSRARRLEQLLSPDLHPTEAGTSIQPAPAASPALEARVSSLEREVSELRAMLEELLT